MKRTIPLLFSLLLTLVFTASSLVAQPAGNGRHFDGHRFARAKRFLYNDTFRAKIEAKLSDADRAKVEALVTDAKTNLEQLKALRPEFKAAREAKDTAALRALRERAKPIFQALRSDRKQIMEILRSYRNSTASSGAALQLQPIYPNPVSLGATNSAKLTYSLPVEGEVRVTISDANGSVVRDLGSVHEASGSHTAELNLTGLKSGTYYVQVQTAGATRTTKLALVQ